jgi:two-component system, NarL family, sensor kinase
MYTIPQERENAIPLTGDFLKPIGNVEKDSVHLVRLKAYCISMVKKSIFYSLYLLLATAVAPMDIFCQTSVADSLLKKLPGEKNDSLKIVMLRDIGYDYEQTDAEKSSVYYLQALASAKKTNNKYQYLAALNDYGNLNITIGKYDSAEVIFKDLLSKTNNETSYRLTAGALANLGNIYLHQSRYGEAQEYYLKAIDLFEKNNDEQRLTKVYGNISSMFCDLRQLDKAIMYAKKMLTIATRSENKENMVIALNNLSNAYDRLNNYKKVDSLLHEALPIAIELNNPFYLFNIYFNLGSNYIELKNYDQAIALVEKSITVGRTLSNKEELGLPLSQLGRIFRIKNNYAKALPYLKEAEQILTGSTRRYDLRELYLVIAETEKKMGHDGRAYDYLYKYAELKDTIYNDVTSAKIAELEINYQTAKKEKDILLLQQESKSKTDSIQKGRSFSYILLGSFFTLLLISFLSYRTYKQNQLLQQQEIKQLQNEKLLLATESVLKGQEDERSRMAQDLHDGLGGMLSGVKLTLGAMKGNIILSEESGRLFTKAFEQLDSSIGEMRRVAHNMMPEALVKLGLQQALQDYCDGINETQQLAVMGEFHGLENRLEASTEIIIYRIVQELINNIIKHADASNVLVQVMKNDAELSITVEDNGKGFSKAEALLKNGAGLRNIQSRVDYLRGNLDIKSAPGKGTSVQIDCTV